MLFIHDQTYFNGLIKISKTIQRKIISSIAIIPIKMCLVFCGYEFPKRKTKQKTIMVIKIAAKDKKLNINCSLSLYYISIK